MSVAILPYVKLLRDKIIQIDNELGKNMMNSDLWEEELKRG